MGFCRLHSFRFPGSSPRSLGQQGSRSSPSSSVFVVSWPRLLQCMGQTPSLARPTLSRDPLECISWAWKRRETPER